MLTNVATGAVYYMTTWDIFARPKALRSQVWDLQKEIRKTIEELSRSPLVQSCMSFFLDECTKIKKENPDFDYMESDLHVDAFIDLLEMWNDSMEVKNVTWEEEKPIRAESIRTIKEALADLAEELAQKKAAAQ